MINPAPLFNMSGAPQQQSTHEEYQALHPVHFADDRRASGERLNGQSNIYNSSRVNDLTDQI